jgi:hypothetical protein
VSAHCPATSRCWGGPAYRIYLLALLVFTLGNSSDAFLLVRAGELGVPHGLLPILWCVFHVAKSGGNWLAGRFVFRIGPRPMILVGWGFYTLVYLALAFASAARDSGESADRSHIKPRSTPTRKLAVPIRLATHGVRWFARYHSGGSSVLTQVVTDVLNTAKHREQLAPRAAVLGVDLAREALRVARAPVGQQPCQAGPIHAPAHGVQMGRVSHTCDRSSPGCVLGLSFPDTQVLVLAPCVVGGNRPLAVSLTG